jgi:hypothetical protein
MKSCRGCGSTAHAVGDMDANGRPVCPAFDRSKYETSKRKRFNGPPGGGRSTGPPAHRGRGRDALWRAHMTSQPPIK